MSEEITKAMDEQRALEQRYAMLVKRRGELKGLSHKAELAETKEQIMVSKHTNLILFLLASFKGPQKINKETLPSVAR